MTHWALWREPDFLSWKKKTNEQNTVLLPQGYAKLESNNTTCHQPCFPFCSQRGICFPALPKWHFFAAQKHHLNFQFHFQKHSLRGFLILLKLIAPAQLLIRIKMQMTAYLISYYTFMLKSSKWLYTTSSEIRQLEQMKRMQRKPLNQGRFQLCFLFLGFFGKKHVALLKMTKIQRYEQQKKLEGM